MTALKEIGIPGLLWICFIYSGISSGLDIGMAQFESSVPMPIGLQIAVYTGAFFLGIILAVVNMKRKKMSFEIILERIFTASSYETMERRIKPFLLGATFFGLIGGIGIIQAIINDMPSINRQVLQAPLFLSVGIVVGWVSGKGETWRNRKVEDGI